MKHHDLANTKGNENTSPVPIAIGRGLRRKKSAVICEISGKYFQMKTSIAALLLFAGFIFTDNVFSQCKDRKPFNDVEVECAKKSSDPSYLLDGQQYRAIIKGQEIAEFYLPFYGGNLYRIAACSDIGGPVGFTVKDDPQGNVLFSNTTQQYAPYWDMDFNSTVNCKIEASFSPEALKTDSVGTEGCVVLIIGYKQK